MPQAIGNPENLRAFAATLERYGQMLDDETATLCRAFDTLGDSWQDVQKNRFEEVFRELVDNIARFRAVCDEFPPHLRHLAEHLDDYLNC